LNIWCRDSKKKVGWHVELFIYLFFKCISISFKIEVKERKFILLFYPMAIYVRVI
jgi:hypothetical protein